MSTLVVQSFRHDPPEWIARCLKSVQAWAAQAGFGYRFVGDALFERLPAWAREKTAERLSTASDLARVYLLSEFLEEGWERVVWLDADVLVFDPARLTAALDLSAGYLLGREAWVATDAKGRPRARKGVHNALLAVRRGNAFLPFYREAAERILFRHEGAMVPQLVGPKFLTALDNMMGLPASWRVNMASPRVVADLARGGGPAVEALLARSDEPPAAFNLCHSYLGRGCDDVSATEFLLGKAIDVCLARGSALAADRPAGTPRVRHEDDAP